jgi:hypothetical protein
MPGGQVSSLVFTVVAGTLLVLVAVLVAAIYCCRLTRDQVVRMRPR